MNETILILDFGGQFHPETAHTEGGMEIIRAFLYDVCGVKGDARTYDPVVAVRAVVTSDFMTCEYAPLPHHILSKISVRITGEIAGISRVVYDITDKPPATVEWE